MLLSVLLALTVIIITARLMGLLFSKLDQPAVIGEVVGGILLGPSLLGRFAPGVAGVAAPGGRGADSRRHLAARRDPLHVSRRPRARSGGACAAPCRSPSRSPRASIIVPFALGAALVGGDLRAARAARRAVLVVHAVCRRRRCRSPRSRCSRGSCRIAGCSRPVSARWR